MSSPSIIIKYRSLFYKYIPYRSQLSFSIFLNKCYPTIRILIQENIFTFFRRDLASAFSSLNSFFIDVLNSVPWVEKRRVIVFATFLAKAVDDINAVTELSNFCRLSPVRHLLSFDDEPKKGSVKAFKQMANPCSTSRVRLLKLFANRALLSGLYRRHIPFYL